MIARRFGGPVEGFEFDFRGRPKLRLLRLGIFHDARLSRRPPRPLTDASRFQERKQSHDSQKYRESAKNTEPQPVVRRRLPMGRPLFQRHKNAHRRHDEKSKCNKRMTEPPRQAVPSDADFPEPFHCLSKAD